MVIRLDRRLEAMRSNPRGDWRISDIAAVCRTYGLRFSPPRGGGSHFKVAHGSLEETLSIPFARPIKAVYIRRIVAMVDALESEP